MPTVINKSETKSQVVFLRNEEISDKYGVNKRTVVNWKNASISETNELDLVQIGKRYFIIDNPNNRIKLAAKAAKARPKQRFKKSSSINESQS